jgi:hypothetical protein
MWADCKAIRSSTTWLLLLLSLVSCASKTEKWFEVPIHRLTFYSLYQTVLDLVEAEGYQVLMRNSGEGTIETEWQTGISLREVRGTSRQKVHVDIQGTEVDGFIVAIRVQEQVIRKGGLLGLGLNQERDWEDFPDNFDEAERLAAKVRALLSEYTRLEPPKPRPSAGDSL